ncbi:hypothetical protein [Dubosiella newyorkensis]|uniref:hypothetical protein n=1 Tax=Dubosiella newyorkensis TaxID=1862672 RepID=UPI002730B1D9|nr:hypothetical protein [Dubosiella newyorkensis]
MIVVKRHEQKLRDANELDIKKDTILHDGSGDCYKILEVVWDLVHSYMLIQHTDKKRTMNIPCDRIGQYQVQA